MSKLSPEEIMKESKDIKELNDQELLLEIKKTNNIQLKHIGLMAYTEMFNRVLYLETLIDSNRDIVENLLKEESKFKEIYEIFENELLSLDSIRFIKKGNKYGIDELVEIRRKIVLIIRTLTAYMTELNYANDISKEKAYINFIRENFSEIEENMDFDRLIGNIQMFLSEDARNIKAKVVDIVSVLPLKISKVKYYDMIENAFKKTMKEASKDMIDVIMSRYKMLFDGKFESEYGVYFDRYFVKAEAANKFDFKNATDKELNEIYKDTSNSIVEVTYVAALLREYGIILNRIIAIEILKDYIIDGLQDNDIKTLLTDWNNYLKNPEPNREKVINSYKHAFNKLDDIFKDNNNRLQQLTMENFNRGNKVDDELKESLQKSQYVLTYINDYNLEDEEIKEMTNYTPAGEGYLKEAIKDLIDYIERNSKDMLNIQRKTRMRRVISLVEGVFPTPQDFFDYLTNSLNMTNTKEEKIAIANNILEIMSKYREDDSKSNLKS
ncbi:MAG: hypothetical protein Q4P31_00425 [Andreesenia angusta]|nr:hypothetical protein [Andreesenia angusta]